MNISCRAQSSLKQRYRFQKISDILSKYIMSPEKKAQLPPNLERFVKNNKEKRQELEKLLREGVSNAELFRIASQGKGKVANRVHTRVEGSKKSGIRNKSHSTKHKH
jgi:hypothetical protein